MVYISSISHFLYISLNTFSVDVSPWHMICGGQGMLGPQSSCKLFNWKTREQCQIQDFPYPAEVASGIVFNNDVP